MCDRTVKPEQQNYVHLILNIFVKESSNFVRKYYLIAELLIFKYR